MKSIKNTLKGLVASTLLYSGIALADFFNVQPAIDTNERATTVRLEGGADISDKVSLYGFMNLNASEESPFDFENYYLESRLAYAINDKLKLSLEIDSGSDMEDFQRLGVLYTPETWKNNFTMIRLFPFETNGNYGPQATIFTSQDLTDKTSLWLTVDYNIEPEIAFVELELNNKMNDRYTRFVQLRAFGPIDDLDSSVVFGLKYEFYK